MRPGDYGAERTIPRPGHADFGQWIEMGRIPTGGGKNSGRLTAPLCAVGALCLEYLAQRGIFVQAQIVALGSVVCGKDEDYEKAILRARDAGDSVGGIVGCTVSGLPPAFGGPLFDGLETDISAAVFGIPGVKGIIFGDVLGCEFIASTPGSKYNDQFTVGEDGLVGTKTNQQGGIMGGRTYGMPVCFTVAMRPTPTVFVEQNSVDLATMKPAKLSMKGRHDPCIARRAVPVVEAVTAFAVMDALLAAEAERSKICLTLTGKTLAEDIAQYRSQRYFTDMVELRVDLLKKGERAKAAKFPAMLAKEATWRVPCLLTFRRKRDGGAFEGDEAERVKFFEKVLAAKNAKVAEGSFDYVDFEEGFGDEKLVALAHKAGANVVRSLHKFDGPVKNLKAKLRELAKSGDVAKVAFMPRNLGDVAKVFAEDLGDVPRVVCAMGAQGFATRALASRFGSLWTYASVGGLGSIGHITPYELVRDFRFRSVSQSAALYGVTGWPLEKTRSPELHNAAFANEDEDAVMIPFPAKTAKEAFAFMKAMGMRGMAVTIPHKFAIMPLLDKIDKFAKKVGAVNTVVCENGKYVGYNTDVEGFADALSAFAGTLSGKSAALLGDGGAAQAVKVALRELGVKFKVFHRATPPQGYDILVNATPVDPIPDYKFTGRELVYDLRYVPEVTPLMARAAKAGCRVENGFSMLRAQARGQQAHFLV
jgi:3-dehydroquinate dehydratase/shikimate dehydrogenase